MRTSAPRMDRTDDLVRALSSDLGRDLFDHALDLFVGTSCLGCGRPGRLVCLECRASLPVEPGVSWPSPTPPGLAKPWAAGAYEGLVRRMVIDHKEESRYGLGSLLGRLLAGAVAAATVNVTGTCTPGTRLMLVPVPSRPGVARRRGDDPTRRMICQAARTLTACGLEVRVAGLLRSHRGVADQAGLDALQRARNVAGSMWVPSARLRRTRRSGDVGLVILCDDVLTTGSTVREGQRALTAVGIPVSAIAVVAAARRNSSRIPTVPGSGSGVVLPR